MPQKKDLLVLYETMEKLTALYGFAYLAFERGAFAATWAELKSQAITSLVEALTRWRPLLEKPGEEELSPNLKTGLHCFAQRLTTLHQMVSEWTLTQRWSEILLLCERRFHRLGILLTRTNKTLGGEMLVAASAVRIKKLASLQTELSAEQERLNAAYSEPILLTGSEAYAGS